MEQVKSRTRQKLAGALVTDGVGNEVLTGSAIAVGAFAVGSIAAWAVSCFVAGIVAAGGPLALIQNWWSAVTMM
jgi:hypothetical protein